MLEELPANYVCSITVSPNFLQDGICLAAQQSGLYRSTDRGASWQNIYQSLAPVDPIATHAAAFSPDFIHDRTIFASLLGAIWRSTDGGDHWQSYELPSPPPVASGLIVSPNYMLDGQAFCATVEDGVFITRDRGSHWATWNFGLLDLQVLCLEVSPQFSMDGTLLIGAESGIYRSKNGGRAWKTLDFPAESAPVTSLAISTSYEMDSTLFAGTLNGELFRSSDQGNHWEAVSRLDEAIDQILIGKKFQHKPEILLLSGSEIWYSANAGKSWKKRRFTLPTDNSLTCLAAPDGISTGCPLLAGTYQQGVVILP